jgi:hypothetical protein
MLSTTLAWSVPETTTPFFPNELVGRWRSIHRAQAWHRLEVLNGGLLLVQLASGLSVTGSIECHSSSRCSLTLDMPQQPLHLEGNWCLWHGTLDFCFLGEYLIFMPQSPEQLSPEQLSPERLSPVVQPPRLLETQNLQTA